MRPSLSSSSSLHRPFTILPTLALLLLSSSLTQASITCESPSSGTSIQPGSSISFRWGDDGSFPRSGDVYSADATVSCSSGGGQIAQVSSISNGQSWTVPRNVLDSCAGGGLAVELSGTRYDMFHWLHGYTWEARCGSVDVEQPAPITTTTTTPAVTTTTTTSATPTSVATTASVTTPIAPTLTLSAPATPTLNGTLPGVLPAPPSATGTNPNATSNGGPSSPNDPSISSSSSSVPESGSKSGGTSKAAVGALGAVGGLAAIAAVVFGFVLVRRRQRRQAREQRWMDHNYSGTSMSENKGGGGLNGGNGNEYAFSGGVGHGAGGAAGLSYLEDQRDGYTSYRSSTSPEVSSSPSLHIPSTEYVIPHPAPPADQDEESNYNNKSQREMSMLPSRPARTYQGEFDDPAPWDGQLGYFPQPPQKQHGSDGNGNVDLGYEYIQDYIPSSDPPTSMHQQGLQHELFTSPHLNNDNDRQLSMRASSQLPADLEYFAQLREASWPMPPLTSSPASPTSPTSLTQPRQSNQQQATSPGPGPGTGSKPNPCALFDPLG